MTLYIGNWPTHFWRVEYHRRETSRHLRIEANLDTRLNLVLTLDEQIKQWDGGYRGLSVVRHETNQCSVPFVDNLRESRGTRGHKDLTHTVVETLHRFIVNPEETLGSTFFCHLEKERNAALINSVMHRPELSIPLPRFEGATRHLAG